MLGVYRCCEQAYNHGDCANNDKQYDSKVEVVNFGNDGTSQILFTAGRSRSIAKLPDEPHQSYDESNHQPPERSLYEMACILTR